MSREVLTKVLYNSRHVGFYVEQEHCVSSLVHLVPSDDPKRLGHARQRFTGGKAR